MSQNLFTSRIWVVPESFGYEEIYLDVVTELIILKPLFIYLSDEKSIKIDQIRQLQKELSSAPPDPEITRVVLIHPLEKLLHVSQQALLKLLEEPPERTVVVLAGRSLNGIAPTILSRCEVVRRDQAGQTSALESAFWTQVEEANHDQLIQLLSTAPDKKEEAVAWVREQLELRPSITPRTTVMLEALTEAYEALLSNVTPKLVWGRVVVKMHILEKN
jgi:hypothetical protein